ncbi:hypothetical protein BAUCODRAFT_158537 [Baudoinia panamericana UAMH 10762]|uniref:Heterokaryon incompatibility domain-containing protein n=1 Tax=Baudoinia panamericana (strain UAMH 10762) TaxID=717646 RepID=M2N4E4_BAUPA|nr:uncharacterized protein BAUCODRAFT_158537 [Baudoinia panamericana UAMH 10762]EMC93889.1 hypothetical protein BAUCODRAFT_158537 [Baudoinia panamericana UAMH 10762]
MDQIYRRAVVVSVWLGLTSIPEHLQHYVGAPGFQEIIRVDDEGFNFYESLEDIVQTPYWSRMWVIQEFLVASDVMLYCSGYCVNWFDLKSFMVSRFGIDVFNDGSRDGLLASEGGQQYKALPLILQRHPDRHRSIDKVFALLGLVPRDERQILSRFFPDYSLSHEQVVLVTLTYFKDFCSKDSDAEPLQLFRALGMKSESHRQRLIRAASSVYSDAMGPNSIVPCLELLEGIAVDDHVQSLEREMHRWEEQLELQLNALIRGSQVPNSRNRDRRMLRYALGGVVLLGAVSIVLGFRPYILR